MKLAVNTVGNGDYTADSFPKVVRLEGDFSDIPDVDGLPAVIKVALLDSDGEVLTSANCKNCMGVRLVKCDASTPTSGTTDGSTTDTAMPACIGVHSQALYQSDDQMVDFSQAPCQTTANFAGECRYYGGQSQTLSSSPQDIIGTVSHVVNGIATFHNLKVRYTFGAGFRLRFIFDFTSSGNPDVVRSVHTAQHGNIFLPDIGLHVSAAVTSFIIRPYALEVLQHPGGDGVDLDSNTQIVADGTLNTPDGAGRGFPFRIQPAVAVKGFNGAPYYFTPSHSNHGHMPVTAVIKSSGCDECIRRGVVLSGTNTGVSATKTVATPVNQSITDDIAEYSGPASIQPVRLGYLTVIGLVGFVWNDLKITTQDEHTGIEGLKLQIIAGLYTSNISNAGKTYTVVETGFFDIFVAPDPPLNVRIRGYGSLGYRIEFDPAKVFRTKPLSGFIVEIDVCAQSGQSDGSCALQTNTAYDSRANVAPRILGSDLYSGGGRVEEVRLSYNPEESATPTAVTITMLPKDYIKAGDNITFDLNAPGLYISSSADSCTPEGSHGEHVTALLTPDKSTVVLTVKSGYLLPPQQFVTIVLPTSCGVVYPDTDPDNATSIQTDSVLADTQKMRYGQTGVPLPQQYATAYITGSVLSDDCKGTGCQPSATRVLPTIQDAVCCHIPIARLVTIIKSASFS